ncbi:Hypothetical predicted protein [Xyrichtys novacula]|uniref:Uncharacterized protein n=2 Tax=Xyrichtys novacula TaxID=13765 RepID=A0AAV1GLQ5_XYRNO|nr:Hypothetical predicted protein [Xyrichtys novacula]
MMRRASARQTEEGFEKEEEGRFRPGLSEVLGPKACKYAPKKLLKMDLTVTIPMNVYAFWQCWKSMHFRVCNRRNRASGHGERHHFTPNKLFITQALENKHGPGHKLYILPEIQFFMQSTADMGELNTVEGFQSHKINLCSVFAPFYVNDKGRSKKGVLYLKKRKRGAYLSQRKKIYKEETASRQPKIIKELPLYSNGNNGEKRRNQRLNKTLSAAVREREHRAVPETEVTLSERYRHAACISKCPQVQEGRTNVTRTEATSIHGGLSGLIRFEVSELLPDSARLRNTEGPGDIFGFVSGYFTNRMLRPRTTRKTGK